MCCEVGFFGLKKEIEKMKRILEDLGRPGSMEDWLR
jgi:hypothetical protein